MFESVQQSDHNSESPTAVDIAPLIDMVFILLIFFLVSTTLVREAGIPLTRPEAVTAAPLESGSLRIVIARSGTLYLDGRAVELDGIRKEVRLFLDRHPQGSVVIVSDEEVSAARLVSVMDAAREEGAREIAISTRPGRST